jgi:hypothetical protein
MMARRRIMNYGPTVRGGRSGSSRQTVSTLSAPSRNGVILRVHPGFGRSTTTKSRLTRQEIRGNPPPGRHAQGLLQANT